MMVSYENIPDELKRLNQWVCTSEDSKVPMQSFSAEPASSTRPETWSDFPTALEAVGKGYYDYCGFVFNDNGIVGIDIDEGYEDGLMSRLAADIIGHCGSYTEKSKSGRGFHVLLYADIPFRGRNNLKGVEIYKASRYFIMTGRTILYKELRKNQEAADYILDKYFPDVRKKESDRKERTRIYSPVWEPPEGSRIKLRPVYPRITPGSRNICLTSLAGMLHNLGYSKKQIYEELMYANDTACDPVLSKSEIQNICNSVTRYKR